MTPLPASTKLRFDELESLYDELAAALDALPPDRESVFLAKLVLSIAHEFGDAERICALIKRCQRESAVNANDAGPNGPLWGAPDA